MRLSCVSDINYGYHMLIRSYFPKKLSLCFHLTTRNMAAICRRRLLKIALFHMVRKRRKSSSKRMHWVRPLFQERLARGEFNLYDELRTNDREYFFRYFRMYPERFDHLHDLIKEKIYLKRTLIFSVPFVSRVLVIKL